MASGGPSLVPKSWSDINETTINLEKLRLLCSDERALKREGHVRAPLDPRAILSKLRCLKCGSKMRLPQPTATDDSQHDVAENDPLELVVDVDQPERARQNVVCEYHPGRVNNRHFTCCDAPVSIQKGCRVDISHAAPDNHMEVLEANWTYHVTPISSVLPTPIPSGRRRIRARFKNRTAPSLRSAIALDCEFGISTINEPELIRVTAIDFFTKEILIDSLVKPSAIIKNYQTRYSGVTAADMRNAVRTQTCIFGRDAAREKLLEYANSGTVIVMHGGQSDMSSLRLIHPSIVDTYILETYFEPVVGGRSLKNLCEKKLGVQIQRGRGHDSHEDALACRELAIWLIKLIPDV